MSCRNQEKSYYCNKKQPLVKERLPMLSLLLLSQFRETAEDGSRSGQGGFLSELQA